MSYSPAQWELVEKQSVSSTNISWGSGNELVFNNLLGDTYDYRIVGYQEATGSNSFVRMRFNGDTGNNYTIQYMYGGASTATAWRATSQSYLSVILTAGTESSYSSLLIGDIIGDSSGDRAYNSFLCAPSSTIKYVYNGSEIWNNSTDELTDITFYGSDSTAITCDIWLLRRPKLGIFNAADWEIVGKESFSGVDLNSNPIDFINLQGDTDGEYLLEVEHTCSSSTNLVIRLNGDSNNNYDRQYLVISGGGLSAGTSTTSGVFGSLNNSSSVLGTTRFFISAESGRYRPCTVNRTGSVAAEHGFVEWWWKNTADEIHTLRLTDGTGGSATGRAILYKRSTKCFTLPSTLQLIDRQEYSSSTISDTIKNLQGDSDGLYVFRMSFTGDSGSPTVTFFTLNGDSSNYYRQWMRGRSAATLAGSGSASSPFGYADSTYTGIQEAWLLPVTGKYRPIFWTDGHYDGSSTAVYLHAYWWQNTADEVEDVGISTGSNVTGFYELYKMPATT